MSMEYVVKAEQVRPNVSTARAKEAQIYFDSSPGQTKDLFNPAELFLTAFAACMIKNVERFAEKLEFTYKKTAVIVKGVREEKPPRLTQVYYELTLWTNEASHRVDLLRHNLEKFGTIFNTVAMACQVSGKFIVRPIDDTQ
jgi:uncharacterized OsmC-like protein